MRNMQRDAQMVLFKYVLTFCQCKGGIAKCHASLVQVSSCLRRKQSSNIFCAGPLCWSLAAS